MTNAHAPLLSPSNMVRLLHRQMKPLLPIGPLWDPFRAFLPHDGAVLPLPPGLGFGVVCVGSGTNILLENDALNYVTPPINKTHAVLTRDLDSRCHCSVAVTPA